MISHNNKNIHGIKQLQGITQTYLYFRFALSIVLILLIQFSDEWHVSESLNNKTIVIASSIYLMLTCINLIQSSLSQHRLGKKTIYSIIYSDILFIFASMHLAGGYASGLSILLLTPIAAAAIFFNGIAATFTAAIATLALLGDSVFYVIRYPEYIQYIVPTGFTGIIFFGTSMSTQLLSKRVRSAQENVIAHVEEVNSLEQLNKYIVQRFRTGIVVLNTKGEVKLFNEAATRLLGDKLANHQAIQGIIKEKFIAWIDDHTINLNPFQQKHGLAEVRVNFSKIYYDGNHFNIIAFIEDNAELSSQAQQLKLNSLARLSASIAHEIRNPLNAISHANQLLLESDNIDPQDERLLEIISTHSQRLNDIVSSTLSISRRSPPNVERIALQPFITDIKQSMLSCAEQEIDFIIDCDKNEVDVPFDKGHLNQVLINLIENALRYSKLETQYAWVKIQLLQHPVTASAILNIYDQGIGIAKENIDKVFEPFYTTDSQGTGMGLCIAKELCQLNQSHLEYLIDDNNKHFQIRFAHPDKRIFSI